MSMESDFPPIARKIEAEPPPIVATPVVPGAELAPPTAEQIRTTDAVFSREPKDSAACLVGFWSAGMLAHDLAQDAVTNLEDDDDESDKKTEPPRRT
ncbi:MAG: hypothetical protein HY040_19050 [Planctomycetes bacterium]|nr:hypothetical protein [Planctomycetota bacterium]